MRIVNMEILGHPINFTIVVLTIVLVWVLMYVISNGIALPMPAKATDDNSAGE